MKNRYIFILCIAVNVITLSLGRLTANISKADDSIPIRITAGELADIEEPMDKELQSNAFEETEELGVFEAPAEDENEGVTSSYIPQATVMPDGTTVFENGTILPINVDEWLEEIDEVELFYKLVEAEAGNQSTLGRRLVADCVLNQMDFYGASYKDIILGVNKFESVSNSHIFTTEVQESTIESCKLEMNSRIDYNVMYFRTEHYHDFGIPYEQVGDHFFSQKKFGED